MPELKDLEKIIVVTGHFGAGKTNFAVNLAKEAKKNGYALDDEENEEGVRCIAASLRDYHNEVKYAFSISGPTSRMTRERVEELSVDVRKVQEELSMELGWYRK